MLGRQDGATRGTLARAKRPLRYLMGGLYIVAGVLHFLLPEVYVQVVPPTLPWPLALVYISGAAEVAVGLGVLVERTRQIAAWGLVCLLVAVFPANVYMATSDVVLTGVPAWIRTPSEAATWARLPLQGVLVWWALWYTDPTEAT
ncbi:hypothetical protein [Halosegnis sp.]|uniref:DoxX family protein n=1 Tax=Halosegnis sp. TaxID=2864959 RepID=UPI0035D4FBB0